MRSVVRMILADQVGEGFVNGNKDGGRDWNSKVGG